jgi:formiminotetrahydrofolate cyclodeaminase
MTDSIWNKPLELLVQNLEAPKPAPAAVTAAAVSARLGLALLIKVLEIVRRRKNFAGDGTRVQLMIDAAREESVKLAQAADDDITGDAGRKRSEIPMLAAQAAESGLALCAEARGAVTGAITADLDAAVFLVEAGLGAIQTCLRSNATESR